MSSDRKFLDKNNENRMDDLFEPYRADAEEEGRIDQFRVGLLPSFAPARADAACTYEASLHGQRRGHQQQQQPHFQLNQQTHCNSSSLFAASLDLANPAGIFQSSWSSGIGGGSGYNDALEDLSLRRMSDPRQIPGQPHLDVKPYASEGGLPSAFGTGPGTWHSPSGSNHSMSTALVRHALMPGEEAAPIALSSSGIPGGSVPADYGSLLSSFLEQRQHGSLPPLPPPPPPRESLPVRSDGGPVSAASLFDDDDDDEEDTMPVNPWGPVSVPSSAAYPPFSHRPMPLSAAKNSGNLLHRLCAIGKVTQKSPPVEGTEKEALLLTAIRGVLEKDPTAISRPHDVYVNRSVWNPHANAMQRKRVKSAFRYPIHLAIAEGSLPRNALLLLLEQAKKLRQPQQHSEIGFCDVLAIRDGPMLETPLLLLIRKSYDVGLIDDVLLARPVGARERDRQDNTPVHLACQYRSPVVVVRHLCILHPEALSLINIHGETPLEISQRRSAKLAAPKNGDGSSRPHHQRRHDDDAVVNFLGAITHRFGPRSCRRVQSSSSSSSSSSSRHPLTLALKELKSKRENDGR